eukprot:scaffold36982_cov52-Phaeocystis_antarctica.AAC.1
MKSHTVGRFPSQSEGNLRVLTDYPRRSRTWGVSARPGVHLGHAVLIEELAVPAAPPAATAARRRRSRRQRQPEAAAAAAQSAAPTSASGTPAAEARTALRKAPA